MSYIEEKKLNGNSYFYFVRKVSFMNKTFILKKNIGAGPLKINKEKYILDNLNELSNKEFQFRNKFLGAIKKEISHSENLPENIELTNLKCASDDSFVTDGPEKLLAVDSWQCSPESKIKDELLIKIIEKIYRPDGSEAFTFVTRLED